MIFKAHLVLLKGFLNFLTVFLLEYLGNNRLALEKEACISKTAQKAAEKHLN